MDNACVRYNTVLKSSMGDNKAIIERLYYFGGIG